jgi:hypothetical protein
MNRLFDHEKRHLHETPILCVTRSAAALSLTPNFSWVWRARIFRENRFNGFSANHTPSEPDCGGKTVETVCEKATRAHTQLKLGVNEIRTAQEQSACWKNA